MIKILVMTHGDLGKEMVRTAELIIGKQEDIDILPISPEDSLMSVCKCTQETIERINDEMGTLILTDMLGGTPCNASLPTSINQRVEIVTGLNLYMLLSALLNRKSFGLEELAKKVIADGQKNIANAKQVFQDKLNPR